MLNNKKEILAIASMILIVVLAVVVSLPKHAINTNSSEKLRIGTSDGVSSILINEFVKRYGSDNIEYKEVETYSFQDC